MFHESALFVSFKVKTTAFRQSGLSAYFCWCAAMEYRCGGHAVFKIQYHFVFVTKYRYRFWREMWVFGGRKLICQTCSAFEVEILKGVVNNDHVHLLVSASLNMALQWDNAKDKRVQPEQAVWEISRIKTTLLGQIFLGKRVLLCDFRRIDRRYDPGMPRSSLWAHQRGWQL